MSSDDKRRGRSGKGMMNKKGLNGQWRRLDNTAKIFPVIANENMSQVFRISVTVKEQVKPEVLQQALAHRAPELF